MIAEFLEFFFIVSGFNRFRNALEYNVKEFLRRQLPGVVLKFFVNEEIGCLTKIISGIESDEYSFRGGSSLLVVNFLSPHNLSY